MNLRARNSRIESAIEKENADFLRTPRRSGDAVLKKGARSPARRPLGIKQINRPTGPSVSSRREPTGQNVKVKLVNAPLAKPTRSTYDSTGPASRTLSAYPRPRRPIDFSRLEPEYVIPGPSPMPDNGGFPEMPDRIRFTHSPLTEACAKAAKLTIDDMPDLSVDFD